MRASDRLSYRAAITAVGVLIPVLLNWGAISYKAGQVTTRVDSLEKQFASLQGLVVAHITATAMAMPPLPQSDRLTVPMPPQASPRVRPQGWNQGDCHLPAQRRAQRKDAPLWHASRPHS